MDPPSACVLAPLDIPSTGALASLGPPSAGVLALCGPPCRCLGPVSTSFQHSAISHGDLTSNLIVQDLSNNHWICIPHPHQLENVPVQLRPLKTWSIRHTDVGDMPTFQLHQKSCNLLHFVYYFPKYAQWIYLIQSQTMLSK